MDQITFLAMAEVTPMNRLRIPAFLKSIIRLYMYLRTIGQRRKENKRMISIEEILEVLNNEYIHAKDEGDEEKMKIFNVGIYIFTIEYDVAMLKQMMAKPIETWGQQLVGRQWVILMYEGMNDLLRLNGTDFKNNLIKGLPDEKELFRERKKITNELTKFKKIYGDRLYELRNYCGAHRDDIAYDQLKYIRSITIAETAQMAAEFMIPIVKLSSLYRRVMSSMTNSRTLI